jgi:hypothetical protein
MTFLQTAVLSLFLVSSPTTSTEHPYVDFDARAIQQLLVERSREYGAIPSEVLCVARRETSQDPFNPNLIGGLGEVGLGQWRPGRGWHWDRTPAWRVWRIDIVTEYRNGNPDAIWHDADMLAWSFGAEAQRLYPGNRQGWSTWRYC